MDIPADLENTEDHLKKMKTLLMVLGFALVSTITIFAFQTNPGINNPAFGEGENPPQRAIYTYCGTHYCPNGTHIDYFSTSCAAGVNYCARQSCAEALPIVAFYFCGRW